MNKNEFIKKYKTYTPGRKKRPLQVCLWPETLKVLCRLLDIVGEVPSESGFINELLCRIENAQLLLIQPLEGAATHGELLDTLNQLSEAIHKISLSFFDDYMAATKASEMSKLDQKYRGELREVSSLIDHLRNELNTVRVAMKVGAQGDVLEVDKAVERLRTFKNRHCVPSGSEDEAALELILHFMSKVGFSPQDMYNRKIYDMAYDNPMPLPRD